jgi:molybdate transport repressor ModE-like protein
MRILPTLAWELDGDTVEVLDARLLPLLRAIAASSSLAAAVADRGMSYRAAWGLLRDYERKLGEPLVLLERGRGATLSRSGVRLISVDNAANRRLSRILPELAAEIGVGSSTPRQTPREHLRLAASHDLLLAALANELAVRYALDLELSFMGSVPALREFIDGRVDIGGFHVPIAGLPGNEYAAMLRGLRASRDRLIRFADRDQGLILPPGNPMKVKTFRDVADQRLRFVNRQPGSGTRLLIDAMLAHEGIDRTTVVGYGNEEFTHRAVAATIASGGADAAFGLRAAAAEHRLAFISLVRERYFLAVRAKSVAKPAAARLIQALRSPLFARIAHRFAGYQTSGAGAVIGLDAMALRDRT